METQKNKNPMRGIPLNAQRLWSFYVARENKLRLNWFRNNEARLNEIAHKENIRKVPIKMIQDRDKNIMESFQGVKRHAVVPPDQQPPIVDPRAVDHIMRPVDKNTQQLIYATTEGEGRVKYLTKRCKIIPEQRYYFPETTSFEYGWNMWNLYTPTSDYARQQVIKTSFYRRRGVERDPDWYKEPAKLSPNVCGCI